MKMNKGKGLIFLALVSVMCYLIFGCDNAFQLPKDTSGVPAGYGRVAVTITGAARTVFPTRTFEKYEYTFAKVTNGTPGTPAAQTPVNDLFELELGEWQVTVKAYAKAADTSPAGTGTSATFTVGTTTATVTVQLAGNVAAGSEGTFSYHIEYPDGAEITVFSLENLLETAPLIELTPAAGTLDDSVITLSGTKENIPAGIYWLTVQLRKDGVTTGANEAVYIYDKLDSAYGTAAVPIIFSKENFFAITYVITGSGSTFTATKDGVTVGTADQPIQDVINAIRDDAGGKEVTVQFGDGEEELNIGTASAQFNNTGGTWGLITLTGKITSANTSASGGTVNIAVGVSIISAADIANTYTTTNSRAIYNASNSGTAVTIIGGTVKVAAGRAIQNNGVGTVNISGGTVSATTGYAVYNYSNGTVNISGGTVSATTDYAVYNNGNAATVNISGGTIEATGSGSAVGNRITGTIILGDSPAITGVIYNDTGVLRVTDTFSPAGKTYTLRFATYSQGTIAVTGGGDFLSNFTLDDDATGYELRAFGSNLVFVTTGFTFVPAGTQYVITGSGTTFTAKRGDVTVGTADQPILTVIDAIRYEAFAVEDIRIQFGSGGEDVLDIGTAYVQFNGYWAVGEFTLTGKITSTNNSSTGGTVLIGDGVSSVNSKADIANAVNGINSRAIYKTGDGTLTISDGTVSANTGVAIYSASAGLITISDNALVTSNNNTINAGTIVLAAATGTDTRLSITGGTVSSTATPNTARAIYNASTGAVTISGGTVSVTGSTYAVYNNGAGAITISSGDVSTENGPAVWNNGDGTVTISGGTLSASGYGNTVTNMSGGTVTISGGEISTTDTGRAVINRGAGTVTISGGEISTTGGSSNTCYGVFNESTGTVTISGGTVSATSTSTSTNRFAVYNNGAGVIDISGGEISATGNNGRAVYNQADGIITLGGDPAITGTIYQLSTAVLGLSSNPAFNPSTGRQYTLDFGNVQWTADRVAVTGGASFIANFALPASQTAWKLAVGTGGNSSDLVIAANP